MAIDMKGLFVNPAQIRAKRMEDLMQRRQQIAGMGGSMAGLLGQVAAGGSLLGEQLAEGIARSAGLKTAEEVAAEQNIEQFKLIQSADNLNKLKSVRKRLLDNPKTNPVLIEQINKRISDEEAAVTARADRQRQISREQASDALAAEQLELQREGVELRREQAETQAQVAEAGLYEKFTADSIAARRTNPSAPLVPLPTATSKAMSSFGKQLADEGVAPGTPEFVRRMNVYNEAKQAAANRENDTTQMSQLEQIEFLQDQVLDSPQYEAIANRQDKVKLARATVTDPNFRTNSSAIRVAERTISEIYNSDSRAQTEINRFLEGKGIAVGFADWVATNLAGSVSKATQENLIELVNLAEVEMNKQTDELVQDVRKAFEGVEGLEPNNLNKAFSRFESQNEIVKTTASGITYTQVVPK